MSQQDEIREAPVGEMREAYEIKVWEPGSKNPTIYAPTEIEEDGETFPSSVLYAAFDGNSLFVETCKINDSDEEVVESSFVISGMPFKVQFVEDDGAGEDE